MTLSFTKLFTPQISMVILNQFWRVRVIGLQTEKFIDNSMAGLIVRTMQMCETCFNCQMQSKKGCKTESVNVSFIFIVQILYFKNVSFSLKFNYLFNHLYAIG